MSDAVEAMPYEEATAADTEPMILPGGTVISAPADMAMINSLIAMAAAVADRADRLLDGVGPDIARAALAGEKPVDALRAQLAGAELRASTSEARAEALPGIRAELDQIKADNRPRPACRWLPLATVMRHVLEANPGLVSYTTVWSWLVNGQVVAQQKDGTRSNSPWDVNVDSLLSKLDQYARRRGRTFFRPEI
ncbi:hypothetical protein [Bradyrhizobium sp. SEMIA]|uniref:hypothetical protein n=1 Tax=Bradyrhizobium sp. SEMIA TaxID=2597515 RepID=UPI0018A41822|nr:hypothetical protein [Bradyrhizobium sp. SEMIA]QOG17530.1 hypothetical protein FOM02_09415 [Bradyrhizobium sp. SEMIA]